MSRKDKLTNRTSKTGNNRSKALNITKRAWDLNIQTVTVKTPDGKKLKLRTSVKTLRTLRKHKKII